MPCERNCGAQGEWCVSLFLGVGTKMIGSLDELRVESVRWASEQPSIAHFIDMSEPTVTVADLEPLKNEIGLPGSYIKCAAALKLVGVTISGFELWPGFNIRDSLYNVLVSSNSNATEKDSEYKKRKLVIVASDELNPVCVGKVGSDYEGEVFFVELMSGFEPTVQRVATNFEQYLLISANFSNVAAIPHKGVDQKLDHFSDLCRNLDCDREDLDFWLKRADEWFA